MKKNWLLIVLIMVFGLAFIASLLLIPTMDASAQIFNCTVRRDVEIPYQYGFFKTRILANAAFEIKLTIRDNFEEKVYVRLIPGTEDPAVTVDEKTLTFYLGSNLYGSTKTGYEVIGSSEDDYEVLGISQLFFQAAILDEDWVYEFDGGDARITDITISSDQARIKYIEFWDNEFRDANMHVDSQDYEDFSDLEDAEWENLSPNTGAPTILNNEDVLYLTTTIPPNYTPTYFPPYYGYPGGSTNTYNVYYGNYPGSYPGGFYSGYPSGPLASFRGNYMGGLYPGYSSLYPGAYPGAYSSFYPSNFQNAFLTSYTNSYYGIPPITNPAGNFGGNPYAFLGLGSLRPTYGFGYPLYGGFIY